ncbi:MULTISPECIES: DUF4249 domain-containing protein [Flavobacterium]|jgi:hypothetical protein|uniref:DUF4249 domain-containing protein n=1 Tax=Flavobacterium cupriresistens TaxID=2893885 RepID=A0ABU4RE48_9FLAO|nr:MULTISPECIES: DUF4249 domain-containing protein [unclassified Flavobacterium]KLT71514.1 hypothetical protein AB674_00140 [Flavobacterium sp. ABG]MDX6190859.1 DUF4249 domain-containing protein [Flavobacterium sp. Fl-318]UFH43969.1 DUF4249 domain-containing protein [Flavobacterium sp. F-323]
MKYTIRHINLLYKTIVLSLFCLFISSCTEQYVFKTNTFESILVVQANITNELKKQEIKITRSYRLEENGPTPEDGATVYVTDSDKNTYEFEFEKSSGFYVSNTPFQAITGKLYQLNITSKDGKSYSSEVETLTTVNEIKVEPIIETIDGEKGVQIRVTSNDPTSKSQFYRFEFEETYKVVAPDWNPNTIIVDPSNPGPYFTYLVVPHKKEARVCYTTKKSDDIILISNVGLSEDRIDLPIRFIGVKDPIILQRYSIIVREYVQNLASYTYYKTLKSLSTSASLLSQVQPGFNYGNLKSNDDADQKIVGYFEVSSVSSKRIFFNFRDIFIQDQYPPFFTPCYVKEYANCWGEVGCSGPKIHSLVAGSGFEEVYYAQRNKMATLLFVTAGCGDCSKISSNIRPLFWVD